MERYIICDRCGEQIWRWSQLAVWVDVGEAWRVHRALRMERTLVSTGSDLSRLPSAAHWHITHWRCARRSGDIYYIEGTRIDTVAKALAWTLHLAEKRWYLSTDWDVVVRRLHDVPFV